MFYSGRFLFVLLAHLDQRSMLGIVISLHPLPFDISIYFPQTTGPNWSKICSYFSLFLTGPIGTKLGRNVTM